MSSLTKALDEERLKVRNVQFHLESVRLVDVCIRTLLLSFLDLLNGASNAESLIDELVPFKWTDQKNSR